VKDLFLLRKVRIQPKQKRILRRAAPQNDTANR
jgi:hypothetical protein